MSHLSNSILAPVPDDGTRVEREMTFMHLVGRIVGPLEVAVAIEG